MGVTRRESDTSSVDAEMNDTPHCDTQRERAKGIAKFFQSSTMSQFESKSYFSEDVLKISSQCLRTVMSKMEQF